MSKEIKISICGDVCSECPRYIATETDDLLELRKIAELWFRLGFRARILDPGDLKCSGCSKDKSCSYNINRCEHLGNNSNCGECDHFPCDKLNLVFQKTDSLNEGCKTKCSEREYKELYKAFLMKRQILTEIHEDFKRINKAKTACTQ